MKYWHDGKYLYFGEGKRKADLQNILIATFAQSMTETDKAEMCSLLNWALKEKDK